MPTRLLILLAVGPLLFTQIASAMGIDEARERKAERARAEQRYGDEALNAKEYANAIDHYTKALDGKACSDDLCEANIYFRRGIAYQATGNCEKAITDFDKAAETIKDNGELYFDESLCHDKLGQPDLALADLNKAININPQSNIYRVGRCIALFNKHDFAGALPDCEMTLTSAPDDQKMLFAAAFSAEQTGDKAKAAKNYRHLLELDPGNVQAKDGLKRVGG